MKSFSLAETSILAKLKLKYFGQVENEVLWPSSVLQWFRKNSLRGGGGGSVRRDKSQHYGGGHRTLKHLGHESGFSVFSSRGT